MKADDIKHAPKVFCESINVAFNPEYFVIALSSGTDSSIYALTPQHAKRLMQYLAHQTKAYEKEHGEIKVEWRPQIVSPIQPKKKGS